MSNTLWDRCQAKLESELTQQQFNTWIRPLHVIEEGNRIKLLAPNRFVLDWVEDKYFNNINEILIKLTNSEFKLDLAIGTSQSVKSTSPVVVELPLKPTRNQPAKFPNRLNKNYTFTTFVEENLISLQERRLCRSRKTLEPLIIRYLFVVVSAWVKPIACMPSVIA